MKGISIQWNEYVLARYRKVFKEAGIIVGDEELYSHDSVVEYINEGLYTREFIYNVYPWLYRIVDQAQEHLRSNTTAVANTTKWGEGHNVALVEIARQAQYSSGQ